MSTDLKIELFSRDLFDALWKLYGFRDRTPLSQHPTRKSELDENILRAVQVRTAACCQPYKLIFEHTRFDFVSNYTDFLDSIVANFPHYAVRQPPSPEAVMSSFLYSCAYVSFACIYCRWRRDDFTRGAHKVWAMFVDLHLKEQFYAHGGWEQLHGFCDREKAAYDFVRTFSESGCELGRNFLLHDVHLTCAAKESFDAFGEWAYPDAPLALKWADFCAQVPFQSARSEDYYDNAEQAVIEEIEAAVLGLSHILNPDHSEAAADERRATTNHVERTAGIVEQCFIGFDGEILSATDPENILRTREPDKKPSLEGQAGDTPKTSTSTNIEIAPSSSDSRPSSQPPTSPQRPTNEAEEAGLGVFSVGVVISTVSSTDVFDTPEKTNDYDDAMNQLGLEIFADYAPSDSRRRVQVYLKQEDLDNADALCDSPRVDRTIDGSCRRPSPLASPNVKNSSFSPCKTSSNANLRITPRKSPNVLNFPLKSPRTSPNVNLSSTTRKSPLSSNINILNSPLKSPLASPNFNALNVPRKSPLTSPNLNALNAPKKSPLTSPNLNALNAPKKSPLTSPNLNALNAQRNSPLTSPNVDAFNTPRRSPLTSPNTNVLGTLRKSPLVSSDTLNTPLKSPVRSPLQSNLDDLHQEVMYTTRLSDTSRRRSLGKENSPISPSSKPRAETRNKGPRQNLRAKHLISPHSNNAADVRNPEGKNDKFPLPQEFIVDIEDPSRDETKPLPDENQCKRLRPEDQSNVAKRSALFLTTSYDPMWGGLDAGREKTPAENDDENDKILERSLKTLEPSGRNELPRPFTEKELNRQHLKDSPSTETNRTTESEDISAQFVAVPSGAEPKSTAEAKLAEDERLKITEYPNSSAEPTTGKETGATSNENLDSVGESNELRTTEKCEDALENPSGRQNAAKKGKKKKQKKRASRLEERVTEEGRGVHDVLRLIFVMGHKPGMASVATRFHDSQN